MARETRPWNAAGTLSAKEDVAAYLEAILEDGDPELLKAALGDIARSSLVVGELLDDVVSAIEAAEYGPEPK